MNSKSTKLLYPIFLGVYPVIGLISVNISQMRFLDGIRSLLAGVLFAIIIYLLFRWMVKDKYTSSLMSAWFFITFFSYGHVYDSIEGLSLSNLVIGRHRFLYPAWVALMVGGLWLIHKKNWRLIAATKVFNWISVLLLAIPIIQIGIFEWQRSQISNQNTFGEAAQLSDSSLVSPDVYYIILDGYARDDILLENYNLDNSDFISQLEKIGFYIPRCSQSNYGLTALSLASSLNMATVDQIQSDSILHLDNWVAFSNSIVHSRVRQTFEDMGYKIVAFQNDIWWAEWSDADYFFSLGDKRDLITNFNQISNFEILFLRTTALRVLEEAVNKWLLPILSVDTPGEHHAKLILLALDGLDVIPEIESPKFVFAHVIAPHEPYVFSPEGDIGLTEAADPGYPNQIQYINRRMVPIIQNIISDSAVPPIIVIQSDHGRDSEVRLANFIALYLPGVSEKNMTPTLTPINIFRLIFNNYFDQNLALLPDTSYHSTYDNYYEFDEITYPCDPNR